jgi:acyl-coenzyme A thioesterase PaaI-like protein
MAPGFPRLKVAILDRYGGFGCGPDSRFGIHLDVSCGPDDTIIADWTPSDQDEGPPGVVHGGVQAIVADAMAGWSTAWHHARTGPAQLAFPVTTHLELRFRRPLPIDTPLHLAARLDTVHGRDHQSIVHLGTAKERRCTIAHVTYRLLDRPWIMNPCHD